MIGTRFCWVTIGASILVAGVGLLWWQMAADRAVVAAGMPPRPELRALSENFSREVRTAEQKAQSLFQAKAGMVAMSQLYHANGFYAEAQQCYEILRQLEPGVARWPHLEAAILAEFGRLDEALPLRKLATNLAPNYAPARLRLGDVLLKSNQSVEAAAAYAEVLRSDAENPYALIGLARCEIIGGNWARARDRLQRAIAANPNFYGAITLLVTVDEHLGDQAAAAAVKPLPGKQEFVDLADPWLDELAAVCFDPYRLSVMAAVANAADDRPTAKRHLERAIALAPKVGTYHRQLAELFTRDGALVPARQHLESALTAAPEDADAWLFLFQNMSAMGESENAARTLAKALLACPQSPSLHLERARWLNRAGLRQEAIVEFRESYRLRPSEAAPLVELATIYFTLGRVEDASQALREALRKQPDHAIAMATLALIEISQGNEGAARSWWTRVRRLSSLPPAALDAIQQAFQQQFGRPLL